MNVGVTTCLGGYHGDTSATFLVSKPSTEARHVVDVARRCRDAGIAAVREGCSVVREYGGHGIGKKMHLPPPIPYIGTSGAGLRLRAGMAFAIEPMVNLGSADVRVLERGWLDGRHRRWFSFITI